MNNYTKIKLARVEIDLILKLARCEITDEEFEFLKTIHEDIENWSNEKVLDHINDLNNYIEEVEQSYE